MAERNYAVSPGEFVNEWLEEEGVTPSSLAWRLGVRESYVAQLLAGQIAVSDPLAQALAELTGIPAKSWRAWEALYQKDKARLARTASSSWRICQTCQMPYQDTVAARLGHQLVKGHHALDAGPWSDPGGMP